MVMVRNGVCDQSGFEQSDGKLTWAAICIRNETQLYELDLFADYFQFYVCDGRFETDTSTLWNETATNRMLAVGRDLLAVGTARNVDVPLRLEILSDEPAKDIFERDQVIDCGVSFPSGTVIAFGCTENPDDAERFSVYPGSYRARVSYANLDDLSADGLEGNDLYRVQLWPDAAGPISIVKQRQIEASSDRYEVVSCYLRTTGCGRNPSFEHNLPVRPI